MKPSEKTVSAFLNIMPSVLYEYDQSQYGIGIVRYASPNSKAILGYPPDYFIGKDLSNFLKIVHKDDRKRFEQENRQAVNDDFFTSDIRIIWPSNEVRWVRFRSKPASKSTNGIVTWVGCIVDITASKHALAKVKKIEGIIPICSYCNKIRNDQEYWNKLQAYISSYSEAEFSHSLCPECLEQHHPEVKKNN
jgi:PAS domain S-box-containing protein